MLLFLAIVLRSVEGFHAFPTLHSYRWWELTGTGAHVCYRNSTPGPPQPQLGAPTPGPAEVCAPLCLARSQSRPLALPNLRSRLLPSPTPELEFPSPHPTVWKERALGPHRPGIKLVLHLLCDLGQAVKPFGVSLSLSVK